MRFQFSLLRLFLAVAMFTVPLALLRSNEAVALIVAIPFASLALTADKEQLGSNLWSVLKALCYLIPPSLLALFLSAGFQNATPPGGVAWPYYVCMLPIPIATYWYAVNLSFAICYGFTCGIFLARPIFIDGRTGMRIVYGLESEAELLAKILAFAVAMTLACMLGYRLRLWREHRLREHCNRPAS
ncbi:hypothetical protein HG15A2_15500 [Adhaeretor mobilis]|uniref:Uncharacterized protein n=1 Tax=Adhaeretor mobilis TaxID=1930276 RepID=A0A517MU26_9BACT|nr:hypothetical protein HG15A2_15500 [Adhaeretor mobilis]